MYLGLFVYLYVLYVFFTYFNHYLIISFKKCEIRFIHVFLQVCISRVF